MSDEVRMVSVRDKTAEAGILPSVSTSRPHYKINGTNNRDKEGMTQLMGDDWCYFRPALFYQPIQSWHIADSGLEFDLNMTTGINRGRFSTSTRLEDGDPARLEKSIADATKIVPDEQGRGDAAAVMRRITNAATWGDSDQLAYLLRACYVTQSSALPALAEATFRGFDHCVRILLDAGVSPSAPNPTNASGKNALHVACEHGQEACAALLISAMTSPEEVYKVTSSGESAFDFLRKNDLNGMARRLDAHARSHLHLDSTAGGELDASVAATVAVA